VRSAQVGFQPPFFALQPPDPGLHRKPLPTDRSGPTVRAMRIDDISFIGWVHTLAYMVAMIVGAMQLVARKRTAAHTVRGETYFTAMVVANITAMVMFRVQDVFLRIGQPPVFHKGFGAFHWLAAVTLLLVLLGRVSASRQRHAFFAYAHPIFMILSYCILIGGALQELFLRVDLARQAALAISPGARNLAGYKLAYILYFSLEAILLAAMVTAVVHIRRFRRQFA
jgi:hypothetical protein